MGTFLDINYYLLDLSVSTHAAIGQFYGPYFTVRTAKFEMS